MNKDTIQPSYVVLFVTAVSPLKAGMLFRCQVQQHTLSPPPLVPSDRRANHEPGLLQTVAQWVPAI